jgi:hypothetical protein
VDSRSAMRSANRAASALVLAMGRMSTSIDIVAAAGSCDSSYVPRIACEPTTTTSGCWMIWQAARTRKAPDQPRCWAGALRHSPRNTRSRWSGQSPGRTLMRSPTETVPGSRTSP